MDVDRSSTVSRLAQASRGPELSHDPSDTLSDVLEVVRLTGALFFLVDARTPWVAEAPASTHLAPVILPSAQHVVSYHVVPKGPCWCESPGHAPLRLETGDVLIVPHGHAYQLASVCGLRTGWTLDDALGWFRAMANGDLPFVVTEGGNGSERIRLVCGFLGCDALPFNPVLTTLPSLLRVRVHGDSAAPAERAARIRGRGVEPGAPRQPVGAAANRGARVRRSAAQLSDDGVGGRGQLVGRTARPRRGARARATARRARACLDVARARA